MFHHDGELAVARAARHAGLPYGVSTLATQPLEAIADAAQGTPLWFQLYLWGDRSAARKLIAQARAAGYRALLLTVDTSVRSNRERELRQRHRAADPGTDAAHGRQRRPSPGLDLALPVVAGPGLPQPVHERATSRQRLAEMFDGTVGWPDLDWIRQEWDGPIALKGVLSEDDARRAADEGVDAVIVSNHGGRQQDHVPAALEVLPGIADAVGDRVRCSSTRGSGGAATSSPPWRSAPGRSWSAGLTSTVSRRPGRPASGTPSTSSRANSAPPWPCAAPPRSRTSTAPWSGPPARPRPRNRRAVAGSPAPALRPAHPAPGRCEPGRSAPPPGQAAPAPGRAGRAYSLPNGFTDTVFIDKVRP